MSSQLTNHGHEDRESPEHCHHRETKILCSPQPKHHVAKIHERQRPDLPEGVRGQLWVCDDVEHLADVEDEHGGHHLTQAQHLEGGEVVVGQDSLVDHHDHEGGGSIEQSCQYSLAKITVFRLFF